MHALLEALKIVMEKEKEAGKILEEARLQADKIKREAEEKTEEVFNQTYAQIIAEARQKAQELQKEAEGKRERLHEAEAIIIKADEEIKKIKTKAEERFEKAVNAALSELIGRV